ncbi:MAG: hypothetical protein IKT20_00680 [Clostridiales bacterium]|nr:hypothetical protein [Clostridiales bacterium]
MKNKEKKEKKVREPKVSENALSVQSETEEHVTLQNTSEIDPELLTGKETAEQTDLATADKDNEKVNEAETDKETKGEPEKVNEAVFELDRLADRIVTSGEEKNERLKRNAGIAFVITAVLIVMIVAMLSFFIDTGMDKSFRSPVTIHGKDIPSDEFSFMYHYELLSEGVDLFAASTETMLSSPYPDDDSFPTYRDYFRYLTAADLQKMEILYDDATGKGYAIEQSHYERANAYVDWLKSKAAELGVPLNTYIKGVFGVQVDEQCIIRVLAKKYFTDDYAQDEKLAELSASDEQAEEAYNESPNIYDVVSYKILRIHFEQRDPAFIETANLKAQQIIEAMGRDPSKFEKEAQKIFPKGAAANTLDQEDSALVPDARYDDFTHTDFREWLFEDERRAGDSTIIPDEDGFPIILVFVQRHRMTSPMRSCYIMTVSSQNKDDQTPDVSVSQTLAQKIYDYIDDSDSCAEIENVFNDNVLSGQLSIQQDDTIYFEKYSSSLAGWIFSDDRKFGDKTIIEEDGTFYVIYYLSESSNPEWYDRVNSYIRQNNYQDFINSKAVDYMWEFHKEGLDQISDVP